MLVPISSGHLPPELELVCLLSRLIVPAGLILSKEAYLTHQRLLPARVQDVDHLQIGEKLLTESNMLLSSVPSNSVKTLGLVGENARVMTTTQAASLSFLTL
jgi:hypothetical protein